MYETTSSEEDSDYDNDDGEAIGGKTTAGLVDMEDIGKVMHKMKKVKKQRDAERKNGELREMVTPMLRKALTKQGVFVSACMCICVSVRLWVCACMQKYMDFCIVGDCSIRVV